MDKEVILSDFVLCDTYCSVGSVSSSAANVATFLLDLATFKIPAE